MIERYTTPEMRQLWSEEHKFETWLEVERAVAQAQARLGIIPRPAAARIARARFDLAQIGVFEARIRHDVIAFLKSVESSIGPGFQYLHFGLTSYDIVDTALALRCRASLDLILKEARRLLATTRGLALKHEHTPMIGRTHGIHAEPITFGLKCLSWYEETKRNIARLERAHKTIGFGKISGAVGTFSQQTPRVEALALRALGLKPEPVATQVLPRDRLAEMVQTVALCVAGLERIALEVRNLQRTEIGEVSESFKSGQRGSSAMPHKKNPITCEQICGLARMMRAYVPVALEDIPLWHERDLTNSSAERIVVPDSLTLTHYLLRQTANVLDTLHVNEARMLQNLVQAKGQFYSQSLMLALIKCGASKEKAYKLTQELSFIAQARNEDLAKVAAMDPRIAHCLGAKKLEKTVRLPALLRHVDYIFRRSLKQPH
jgi:adenylosuccinate lyase